MSDVQLVFSCKDEQCVDIGVSCGDLMTGNDLSTAIYLSLFTDRRANTDDVIPDGTDPRGWWGDAIAGEYMGSRLWLLERSRNVAETLRLTEDYAKEALKWLITDGIVKSFTIAAVAVGGCTKTLSLSVQAYKPEGKSLSWKYRYAWDLSQVLNCETGGDYACPIPAIGSYRATYPIADCAGAIQGWGYRSTDGIDPSATVALNACGTFVCWVYPAFGVGHTKPIGNGFSVFGYANNSN